MGLRMQPRNDKHVPGPVGSETMMPLPPRLPRAEPLGKITPRHPGAITEYTPLDHLAMITPRTRPPSACGINGSIRAQAASLSSAERVTQADSRGHQHNSGDTL